MPISKKPGDKKPIETNPVVAWKIATEYLSDDFESLVSAARASSDMNTMFSPSIIKLTLDKLLLAIFMGEEALVAKIVGPKPQILFERGSYEMPLLNADGTLSSKTVRDYPDFVAPLELSFSTGDWKMWDILFPLIPESMNEAVYDLMLEVQRGGPDLVKMTLPEGKDPKALSWDELKHFQAGTDEEGSPIIYDLLSNPDGLIAVQKGEGYDYYYVETNLETKTVESLEGPLPFHYENDTDKAALKKFEEEILKEEMPNNSSRRSSDEEHALFTRVFKKTLERNGRHYRLDGVSYHDTQEWSHRLINAYRRYIEIFDAHVADTPWTIVNSAWVHKVGRAQHQAMPHDNQRLLERDRPTSPLRIYREGLKDRPLVRRNEFYNYTSNDNENLYPLWAAAGVGIDFGLYKSIGTGSAGRECAWRVFAYDDLAAARLNMEVRKARFNELLQGLKMKLHPESSHGFGSGGGGGGSA